MEAIAHSKQSFIPNFKRKTPARTISDEDFEIITTLETLKTNLDVIHTNLNYATDPILIDSYIFESLSINMKYAYYLNLCKEKGLVANVF